MYFSWAAQLTEYMSNTQDAEYEGYGIQAENEAAEKQPGVLRCTSKH